MWRLNRKCISISEVRRIRWNLPLTCAAVIIFIVPSALAQDTSDVAVASQVSENAEQVARILGISQLIGNARLMSSTRSCEATATVEELSVRQDVMERLLAASFEADGVLAELANE